MKPEKALTLFLNAKRVSKAPSTAKWYASKLKPLIRYIEEEQGITHIETVKIFDLESWGASLTAYDLSPITYRGYIRVAKHFFHWLAQRKLTKENIGTDIELPPKVKIRKEGISEEDRDKIIFAASANPRDHAILLFLADTACRADGLSSLTLKHLYLAERRAYVTEKGLGGRGKGRPVSYGSTTAHALARYLVVRPEIDNPYVFLGYKRGGRTKSHGWKQLTVEGIYSMIERYANKAGVTSDWNTHAWRHGSARSMTRNGMPLQTLAQILGHSSVEVTADIYGLLDEDTLQQMHDIYSPLKPRVETTPHPVDS